MRIRGVWAAAGTVAVLGALAGVLVSDDRAGRAEAPGSGPSWPAPPPWTGPTAPPPEGAQPPPMPDLPPRLQEQLRVPPGTHGVRSGPRAWLESVQDARWNPCEPLRFVVNPDDAPAGAVDDFHAAVYKVDQAVDLTLEVTGTTDAVDPGWTSVPGRPVLVSWGGRGHGVLGRDAAATAQPMAGQNWDGEKVYVAGQITFSTRGDRAFVPGSFGPPGTRIALYMHEIGHIIGLGHVRHPGQLMHDDGAPTDFGAGDLNGLRELTSGPCLRPPADDDAR